MYIKDIYVYYTYRYNMRIFCQFVFYIVHLVFSGRYATQSTSIYCRHEWAYQGIYICRDMYRFVVVGNSHYCNLFTNFKLMSA